MTSFSPYEDFAYQYNSLPRFIFKDSDGNYRNFEAEITNPDTTALWYYKKYQRPSDPHGLIDPIQMYTDITQDSENSDLSLYDVCLIYSLGNPAFHYWMNIPTNNLFYFTAMFDSSQDTIETLESIWSKFSDNLEYKQIVQNLNKEKVAFREEYEIRKRQEDYLKTIKPIPYSTFKTEYVVKVYQASAEALQGSIYNVFNNIVLNEECPFVVTTRYYKVLKGHEYDLEIPEDDNTLFMFTITGKVVVSLVKELYEISFEFKQNENDQEYLKSICDILQIPIDQLTLIREKLNGIYYHQLGANIGEVPDEWTIVWADIIMNNSYLNRFLVIDEHLQATRIRKGFYMYLFIKDERITFTIRLDVDDPRKFRIRLMNVPNIQMIPEVQNKIGLALSIYFDQCEEISKIYNQLLGGQIIKCPQKVKRTEKRYDFIDEKCQESEQGPYPTLEECLEENRSMDELVDNIQSQNRQQKAPNVFPLKFSRKCENPPFVVSNREADRLKSQGFEVLKFPKETEELPSYNFVCLHKAKPNEKAPIYPGLIRNKLANKNIYPLLPCCYPKEQKTKKLFKEYYNTDKKLQDFAEGDIPEINIDIQNIQNRVLISDKFVGYNQSGNCPTMIDQLFSIFTYKKPFRKGVHRSKVSILECILTEINFKNILDLGEQDRLKMVISEIERLNDLPLTICAQERWDQSDEPQKKKSINIDTFLNFKYFIRLLEREYRCRLVVLDRDDFIQPNFTQGYVRWKYTSNEPVVVVYQHFGSGADEAEYPQCEILSVDLSQEELGQVKESIHKLYVESLQTFPYTFISTKFISTLETKYDIMSQQIDYNGKVWGYNVKDKKRFLFLTLFADIRLPPIDLERSTEIYYKSSEVGDVLNIEGVRLQVATESDKSVLEKFQNIQTQVELMVENSKYIMVSQEEENKEQLDDFSFIQMGKPIVYSKQFFSDSKYVYVPNEETRKRLQYVLSLEEKRNIIRREEYKNKNIIPYKFNKLSDFIQRADTIIAETASKIDWGTDIYTLLPVDNGMIYPYDFLTQIQNAIYKCSPIENIEDIPRWKGYKVLFPQAKTIYQIGSEQEASKQELLVIKGKDKLKFYYCTRMYRF
jgi:hypothetical protein